MQNAAPIVAKNDFIDYSLNLGPSQYKHGRITVSFKLERELAL